MPCSAVGEFACTPEAPVTQIDKRDRIDDRTVQSGKVIALRQDNDIVADARDLQHVSTDDEHPEVVVDGDPRHRALDLRRLGHVARCRRLVEMRQSRAWDGCLCPRRRDGRWR